MTTPKQVVLAVLITALLCGADMTLARSVAKRSVADGTCMSQWLRLATENSAAPVNVTQLETSIYWLLVTRKANSVSELEPKYLDIAVGSTAAQYLRFCLGNESNQTCKAASPCQNGGVCTFHPDPSKPKLDQFVCICPTGFTGKFCEEGNESNQTCKAASPCQNGGVCTFHPDPTKPKLDQFVCICPTGFTGKFCEEGKEPNQTCEAASPCQNGGVCTFDPDSSKSKLNQFVCICPTRFTGKFCEEEWISPQLIANISLTLSRIIGEQKAVDQRLESFSRSSANQISGLEGRLENSMNSRLRSVSEAINAFKASTQSRSAEGAGSMMGVSPPGKILDRAKCSSLITVLPNGRVAWNHNPISRNAAVLGVTGYRSGIHRWTFQVNGLVITNGLGVGFTTLPVDGNDYERGWSPSTVYAWFSNQFTGGLASSQTSSTAKMAQWLNGDILTLTLNVEAQTMEMFHHHTKERKTIRLDNNLGKPLYLWIFLGQPRHRIIFLPNSE